MFLTTRAHVPVLLSFAKALLHRCITQDMGLKYIMTTTCVLPAQTYYEFVPKSLYKDER